jgi:hypothetical protein
MRQDAWTDLLEIAPFIHKGTNMSLYSAHQKCSSQNNNPHGGQEISILLIKKARTR